MQFCISSSDNHQEADVWSLTSLVGCCDWFIDSMFQQFSSHAALLAWCVVCLMMVLRNEFRAEQWLSHWLRWCADVVITCCNILWLFQQHCVVCVSRIVCRIVYLFRCSPIRRCQLPEKLFCCDNLSSSCWNRCSPSYTLSMNCNVRRLISTTPTEVVPFRRTDARSKLEIYDDAL